MDEATVLEYMRIQNLVGFEGLARYIADVTNEFIKQASLPGEAGAAVGGAIAEMARLQKKRYFGLLSEESIKRLLFSQLESSLFADVPESVKKIPWPANHKQPTEDELSKVQQQADLQKYSADIQRLKSRSRNIQFSERLVQAAKALEGWFCWVKSGPSEGTFSPREQTSEGETNDFVKWVHGRGDEPTRKSNMNCWEAVFFAAYKAGLITISRLRAFHIKATMAKSNYFNSLTNDLGYRDSFPYVPGVGLTPAPGDVIFLGRDHHVALCVETGSSVKVMSNWTMPSPGFGCHDLEEFTANGLCDVRFGSFPVRD